MSGEAVNNNKEIWRRETQAEPFKSYACIDVTPEDGIVICLGGYCIGKPIEKWHSLATDYEALEAKLEKALEELDKLKGVR